MANLEQQWNAERTGRLLAEDELRQLKGRLEELATEMEGQDGRASMHYATKIREMLND